MGVVVQEEVGPAEESRETRMLLERTIEKAISGQLRLEDLRELRDWEWCGSAGWVIFEDLESGVEHFPGYLFGGGADWETWHSSCPTR
jgi:hypothetical protein